MLILLLSLMLLYYAYKYFNFHLPRWQRLFWLSYPQLRCKKTGRRHRPRACCPLRTAGRRSKCPGRSSPCSWATETPWRPCADRWCQAFGLRAVLSGFGLSASFGRDVRVKRAETELNCENGENGWPETKWTIVDTATSTRRLITMESRWIYIHLAWSQEVRDNIIYHIPINLDIEFVYYVAYTCFVRFVHRQRRFETELDRRYSAPAQAWYR